MPLVHHMLNSINTRSYFSVSHNSLWWVYGHLERLWLVPGCQRVIYSISQSVHDADISAVGTRSNLPFSNFLFHAATVNYLSSALDEPFFARFW